MGNESLLGNMYTTKEKLDNIILMAQTGNADHLSLDDINDIQFLLREMEENMDTIKEYYND